ncbi:MAG: hypothetical protein NT105_09545 [Verrucomicrobia bacterium]|nr:hypothetical protein [Verrucomicrobiota bacterium]
MIFYILVYLGIGAVASLLHPHIRRDITSYWEPKPPGVGTMLKQVLGCSVLFLVGSAIWPIAVFACGRQRSALDRLEELLVSAYRMIGAQHGCAPTSQTSDREIVEIYKKVVTAFRQASEQRGEHLPATVMNFIVWKFFQIKEQFGDDMVDEHLKYEVEKYLASGLRPDYQRDLHLF